MRRLAHFLSSLRASIVLIAALSVTFLLGLWIPQQGLLQQDEYLRWKEGAPALVSFLEVLGLTNIYTSPLTVTLWSFFFLNLALVMWKRGALLGRQIGAVEQKLADPVAASAYSSKTSLKLAAPPDPERLTRILARDGYRFYGSPERFYAVKNRLSPWATLLFHLSFFFILMGGVLGVYTRFAGSVDLAEGEEFHGEPERYSELQMPRLGAEPRLHVAVRRISPELSQGKLTGITVEFDEAAGGGRAEVNRPYVSGDASLVVKDLGLSPLLVLSDSGGRELDGAYVKLKAQTGQEEVFNLGALHFTARFYPDYQVVNGVEGSRSQNLANPAFNFAVRQGERLISRQTVRPGETVVLGGYRLSFPELRYWARFSVVAQRGSGMLIGGFALGAVALCWRLLFYRRELIGTVTSGPDGTTLHLAGKADFYRALFQDEFALVARKISSG